MERNPTTDNTVSQRLLATAVRAKEYQSQSHREKKRRHFRHFRATKHFYSFAFGSEAVSDNGLLCKKITIVPRQ